MTTPTTTELVIDVTATLAHQAHMTEVYAQRPTAVLVKNVEYITNWLNSPEVHEHEYRDIASEARILSRAINELMRRGVINLDEVS